MSLLADVLKKTVMNDQTSAPLTNSFLLQNIQAPGIEM
jgi:hypothetical protein